MKVSYSWGNGGVFFYNDAGNVVLRVAKDGEIQKINPSGGATTWKIDANGEPGDGDDLAKAMIRAAYGLLNLGATDPGVGSIPYTNDAGNQAELEQQSVDGKSYYLKALTNREGIEWAELQSDRIATISDATTYVVVDDTTGDLIYYASGSMVARVTTSGQLTTFGVDGKAKFQARSNGEIRANCADAAGNGYTYRIQNDGTTEGLKLGFKQG